ncbi:MAG TPA: methyltransferase [Chitinophagaceae bacterium]
MPNPYFQFKQFTIFHDRCAMKVCTDACILGAWFADRIKTPSAILDIGAGSGLLMMMLAQKNKSDIHGIEIDEPSFSQLTENINQSKWNELLKVYHGDVRKFLFPVKYDFIITNPPFFENDLQSEEEHLNVAKHSKQLTLEELLKVIDTNLSPEGSFGILLPHHRMEYFTELCRKAGYNLSEQLLVKQSPAHNFFRVILHFSRVPVKSVHKKELIIQDDSLKYTKEFTELLKDYYLYL